MILSAVINNLKLGTALLQVGTCIELIVRPKISLAASGPNGDTVGHENCYSNVPQDTRASGFRVRAYDRVQEKTVAHLIEMQLV